MREAGEAPGERPGSRLVLVPLQLAALSVWLCVRRRDVGGFGRVLEFLQAVSGGAPGLVTPRHLAKLQLGLKAKIILEMFLQDCPPGDIRCRLGHLFPVEDSAPPRETLRDSQKVREIQRQFRDLVLHLLGDPSFRSSFLEVEAGERYGERFLAALDKLLWEFLLRLQRVAACPRLQPSSPPDQPVVGVLSQLPPQCLQLLLSGLGSTHSLHPGTLLLLSDVDRAGTDPHPSRAGTESPEGGEVRGGGADGAAPGQQLPLRWAADRRVVATGRRSPRGRRVRAASPHPGRNPRRQTTEKENTAGTGPRRPARGRLGVPAVGDMPDTELGGPEDGEATDVVSDSEGESSEPLSSCLRGKRPLWLYQRTKHNTLIPTLLQHLGPPAVSSRHLALDRMPNPGVS